MWRWKEEHALSNLSHAPPFCLWSCSSPQVTCIFDRRLLLIHAVLLCKVAWINFKREFLFFFFFSLNHCSIVCADVKHTLVHFINQNFLSGVAIVLLQDMWLGNRAVSGSYCPHYSRMNGSPTLIFVVLDRL